MTVHGDGLRPVVRLPKNVGTTSKQENVNAGEPWVLTTDNCNYTIEYELGTDATISGNPTTADFNDIVTIPYPTRDGYAFAGWSITNYDETNALTGQTEDIVTSNLKTVLEAHPTGETDKTKNKYFKNLSTTGGSTVTLRAEWQEVPSGTPATQFINANNYGDKVNFNANGVSDWKIFLNDKSVAGDEHVYLIAGDYVPNSGITAAGINKVPNNDYAVNGEGTSRDEFVEALKDPTRWSNYAAGINNATATGSPTLEQFWASYNGTYGTSYSGEIQDLSSHTGHSNTLYFPHKEEWNDIFAYWLASPDSSDYRNVKRVTCNGAVYYYNYSTTVQYAVRPVIKLPTNCEMTWNGSKNSWFIEGVDGAHSVTAQDYGDKVDYSVDVTNYVDGGTQTVDDWKLFYKGHNEDIPGDEDHIFLISSDVISNKLVNTTATGMTRSTDNDYGVYWETVPLNKQSVTNFIKPVYDVGASTSTYDNSTCVSTLLNVGNWTQFVTNAKSGGATISGTGLAAQGGPTLEMWTNSWKNKGLGEFTFNDTLTGGVGIIGAPGSVTGHWCVRDLNDPYSLYNNNNRYWLASPRDFGGHQSIWAFYQNELNGCFVEGQYGDFAMIRPIIRLPSNIKAQWNGEKWVLSNP